MRSPHAATQLANGGQDLEKKVQAVVFARLDDENIDVRKVTFRLFVYEALTFVLRPLVAWSKPGRSISVALLEALLSCSRTSLLLLLMQSVGVRESVCDVLLLLTLHPIEHRHGLAFAASRLANPQSSLVAQLEWSLVARVLGALPPQIQHQHNESKEYAATLQVIKFIRY